MGDFMSLLINRNLDIKKIFSKKNFFLFGARSTGKSFLIRHKLKENFFYINLLDTKLYLRLVEEPSLLESLIKTEKTDHIIIDEIQKIPELLDEVHRLIEEKNYYFLLTGSSARKLKRSHANMLGGRAGIINFYPLSYSEITDFDLQKYLLYGGIPRIYLSEDPVSEQDQYITTYIEQEIKLEANLRNLSPFHRFLKVAALTQAELINYANISNDSGVAASTVKEYYSVLEDSLIGYVLEPWLESKKRKAIQTAKFYFFDTGVCNYIAGIEALERNSDLWGKSFEQFILMELKTYISYKQKRKKIYFWRTINQQEVDFIVGDKIAIEVKSSKKITRKHLKGLIALKEENIIQDYYVVSEDPLNHIAEGFIHVIHWKEFLRKLWNHEIV